jgi:hypothetical protein
MKPRDDRQKAYGTMARRMKNMEVSEPCETGDIADTHSEIEILTEDPRVLEAAEQSLHAAPKARQARFTETKGKTYTQSVGSTRLGRS